MSVYSMTGYGSATLGATQASSSSSNAASITVEIRSVNGRFLDVAIKAPDDARGLDSALRELVASRIKRGKVEVRVAIQRETDAGGLTPPTPEQLLLLSRIEGTVRGYLDQATPLSVHEVMQWCRQATPPSPRREDEAMQVARDALGAMVSAREREGARLVQALKNNIARLRTLAHDAKPLVGAVIERQQQRFIERWRDALAAVGGTDVSPEAAQERALAEAATYALRIDVAEELTRLASHLDELDTLLDRGGELGKRLDFLVQELHREANTLGSKSQAIELTTISMEMRVAIEQMREQVQNIE